MGVPPRTSPPPPRRCTLTWPRLPRTTPLPTRLPPLPSPSTPPSPRPPSPRPARTSTPALTPSPTPSRPTTARSRRRARGPQAHPRPEQGHGRRHAEEDCACHPDGETRAKQVENEAKKNLSSTKQAMLVQITNTVEKYADMAFKAISGNHAKIADN